MSRGVFVGEVDHRGTSQTCPNCRITVKKELSDRIHYCPECHYEVDRDVADAQEICNRGIETYPGTLEKQEIGSQVEVSGVMCLDNWRRGAMPNCEVGKPTM
ncbi:MAG: zinc ribbon domain-containing protein [Coleofasciculus sp. G3-WIS-01]